MSQDLSLAEQSEASPDDADGSRSSALALQQGWLQRLRGWVRQHVRMRASESSLIEAVDEIIEEHQEETGAAVIDAEGRAMLHNVLTFNDLAVDDIMTPRADIVAIPANAALSDIKNLVVDSEHTRMPVYRDSLDNVTGFIHTKDLIPYLGTDRPFSTDDVLRQLIVVPPSMRVHSLLLRMRKSGLHMALVVDEYGGTDGLVTLEDIFEHIVGDILDEHDDTATEQEVVSLGNYCYEVLARADIDTLEEVTGLDFTLPEKEEDFDTVGGLIFTLLGRVPEVGESVAHPNGARFTVLEVDPRRVHKVRMDLSGKPV